MDRGTPTTMFNAIQIYRVARYLHLRNVPVLPRLLRKTIQYLHGSYLPPEADITMYGLELDDSINGCEYHLRELDRGDQLQDVGFGVFDQFRDELE